jgi:heterodisulfide reductase subunit B
MLCDIKKIIKNETIGLKVVTDMGAQTLNLYKILNFESKISSQPLKQVTKFRIKYISKEFSEYN